MDQDIAALKALQLVFGARQHMASVEAKMAAAADDTRRQELLASLTAHADSIRAAFADLGATGWTPAELKARYAAMIDEIPALITRYDEFAPLVATARSDIRQLAAVNTKLAQIRTAIEPEVKVRP